MKTLKTELPHWLILTVPFIYLATVYAKLPDIIPTHFDGDGTPNGYSHKTLLLWILPSITIGIYLLMLIVPVLISKQYSTPIPKTLNWVRLLLTFILSALAVVTIYISKPNANLQLGVNLIWIGAILMGGTLILYTIFMIKTFSLTISGTAEENKSLYKWGLFYYNTNDKKLWAPKLSGLGYTLNFANPFSYLIFGVIIAFVIWTMTHIPH